MTSRSLSVILLFTAVCAQVCYELVTTRPCPRGTLRLAGTCCLCAPGTYSSTLDASACNDCPAGTFTDRDGADVCDLCLPGSFSAAAAVACTPTAPANEAVGFGNIAEVACAAGFITVNSRCVPCGPGTLANVALNICVPCSLSDNLFNPFLAAAACLPCPVGTVPTPNRASCYVPCRDSSKPVINAAFSCEACPTVAPFCSRCRAGRFANGGTASNPVCTACPTGKFNPVFGAAAVAACLDCPAGTYAAVAGATKCTLCRAGKFSAATAAVSDATCETCADGYAPLPGQTACLPCPSGSIPRSGGSTCRVCPAGKIKAAVADITCTDAAAGTFAPRPGMINTIVCPAGHISAAGKAKCSICPAGKFTDDNLACAVCKNAFAGAFECPAA